MKHIIVTPKNTFNIYRDIEINLIEGEHYLVNNVN